jgi:hypothetical protein
VTREVERDEVPPWERPGAVRRDCEPHRGEVLHWLTGACVLWGLLSFVPCLLGLPGLIGVPLGLTTWQLARHDLAQMRAGLMDPQGERMTEDARHFGCLCMIVNLSFSLFYLALLLLVRLPGR